MGGRNQNYQHVVHTFGPLYNEDSGILILGSIPSPASREVGFYYGHPRNRFWQMLADLYGRPLPESIEEKKALVLSHGLALWDVIEECDIIGASDSSVKNAVPTDIPSLLGKMGVDCNELLAELDTAISALPIASAISGDSE